MANIAILGFGVVGSGVAEVLTENQKLIKDRIHEELNIKYILDLRDFPGSPFEKLVVHDFNTIVNDPEVSIVAEMMGGSHPAYEFSAACLRAGKSVVTSNKEVVANFGTELVALAAEHNVRYLFEASVGGGIPVLRPLTNDLAANRIRSISGILNGTTNYILTQMETCGKDFSEALSEAQTKGYAEADPTADIEGLDAARKIVILAALSFGRMIAPAAIHTEGITKVTPEDFKVAHALGYTIKLIAYSRETDGRITAMVSPRLVPLSNPLGTVNDVFNGILLDTDMLGTTMFYGRGAGKLPTASAVAGDIIDCAKKPDADASFPRFTTATEKDVACFDGYSCRHALICDAPVAGMDEAECEKVEGFTVYLTGEISEAYSEKLRAKCGTALKNDYRIL